MARKQLSGLLSALIVVVIFVASISGLYAFVVPRFIPGWTGSWPLVLGVAAATLAGGYIGYIAPAADKRSVRLSSGFFYAIVVAGLVSWISLFIILNTRGS
jgi:hypothetical protein